MVFFGIIHINIFGYQRWVTFRRIRLSEWQITR